MNIECVAPIAARLGEGPLWSARERAVWFVDIKGRGIHRYDEATRTTRSWQTPQDVGFIVAASGGRFICGFKSGLHLFAPETGSFQLLTPVDGDRPGNRLNDGHVDAAGRLWFGTMDDAEVSPTGALYRFDTFLVAFQPGPGWHYFPSVAEMFISIGLIAIEIAIYIALVRWFPILGGTPARRTS